MSEFKKFWVVRDPGPTSTMGDICFETDPNDFVNFVIGSGFVGSDLKKENLAFFTDEESARVDAKARLARCLIHPFTCLSNDQVAEWRSQVGGGNTLLGLKAWADLKRESGDL